MFRLFGDFETYWSDEVTLKRMTPPQYIANPQFEVLGCAFALDDGRKWFLDGTHLPTFFASIPWEETEFISHNALFDALILSQHYKIFPARYGCTLSMARNWLRHAIDKVSLASCAAYYGLDAKWETVYKFKGKTLSMIRQDVLLHGELTGYAIDDVDKCRYLFHRMIDDGFPMTELDTIDWVIRMAAQPRFEMDQLLLAEHLHEVQANKQALLDRAGLANRDNLMRDPALAAMLTFEGVDVPMKTSKATGGEIFAFAKTDREFTSLLDHDNPTVQALVAARLGHKSTLEETRTQRFIDISRVTPAMPVPLKYSGAHTHRFSGDWSLNMQNLPNSSKLRSALKAPPGHLVVSVDASQIEARLNAVLSHQDDLIEDFRQGIDVYANFAEIIYGYQVSKKTNPVERTVGKVAVLSLGYGASPPVFRAMCRNRDNILLTEPEAANIVYIYRQRMREIVSNWRYAGSEVLPAIANGDEFPNWGPIHVAFNALILPSGNKLRYRQLSKEVTDKGYPAWMFMRGSRKLKVYGSMLVENVIQALAFLHISEVARRIMKMTEGQLVPVHQIHDELLFIVPEKLARWVASLVVEEMSTPPAWMPTAPLAAEAKLGPSYGEMVEIR